MSCSAALTDACAAMTVTSELTACSYRAAAPASGRAGYSAVPRSMGLPPLSAHSWLSASARAVSACVSSVARFMRSIFILFSSSEVASPLSYFSVNIANSSSAFLRLSASIAFCLSRCTRSRQMLLACNSRSRRAVRYSSSRTPLCSLAALLRAPYRVGKSKPCLTTSSELAIPLASLLKNGLYSTEGSSR